METFKQWTVTRSFELEESLARWMAYDFAGQAFELVNCGATIARITLEPGPENIWLSSLVYEDDRHQARRWGRLAQLKAGLETRTSYHVVAELKEIARD